MGRKQKKIKISSKIPDNFYFKSKDGNTINLTFGEYEAMRLKHYVGLNQRDMVKRLGVSQPTISRILSRAHIKLATALIKGINIRVIKER